MTSEKVDVEEIALTKSEKLLTVMLAFFISIGTVWGYSRIDNGVSWAIVMPRSAQVESVQTALNTASRRSETSLVALANAEDDLTIARESYRTALEAGKPVVALERRYRAADSAFRQAREKQRRTASDLARARGEFALVEDPFSNRVDRVDRERTLATMGLRVLFAMSLLGFGYWTLAALRRRRSRSYRSPSGFSLPEH